MPNKKHSLRDRASGEPDSYIDVDYCGWMRCKNASTIIWFGIGLCDNHVGQLSELGYEDTSEKLLTKLLKKCSLEVRNHFKRNT